MIQNIFRTLFVLPGRFRTRMMAIALCIAFISTMLAACGASTTAMQSTPSPTSIYGVTSTPKPSPTRVPTPKPIPAQAPKHAPVATPKPLQAPPPAPTATPNPMVVQGPPAVLDLRPSSMSIVGHLDCQKNGAFVCFARVLSSPSNQSNLHWFAFTNVPGKITFSPSSGTLTPGQSVLVTLTIPFNACAPGLFFFQGPINTHTITWAC